MTTQRKAIQVKDILTHTILLLVAHRTLAAHRGRPPFESAIDELATLFMVPGKVAERALEREVRTGLIDFGSSINRPFITDKGLEWLHLNDASTDRLPKEIPDA